MLSFTEEVSKGIGGTSGFCELFGSNRFINLHTKLLCSMPIALLHRTHRWHFVYCIFHQFSQIETVEREKENSIYRL